MQLPVLLQTPDDTNALQALRRYYNCEPFNNLPTFTGARFDGWDSTGTRLADLDRFTADDMVAVTLLSVDVPALAAVQLLVTDAEKFADLLTAVGPDRDLVTETQPWDDAWAGWQLWNELVALPGVGPTTASKLFARKRPRLRPIYDSVVEKVIGSNRIWDPLRAALVDDPDLHSRLVSLREQARLPESVSALRVFDVVAWMEGKYTADADWRTV